MDGGKHRTVPAWQFWLARLLGRRIGGDGIITVYLWRGIYWVDRSSAWRPR